MNPQAQSDGFADSEATGRKLATLQLKIMLALIIWNFKLLPTPSSLSSLAQHDILTGEPECCYVCLEEVLS